MKKIMGHLLFGIPSGTFIGMTISLYFSWKVGLGTFYPGPPAFMAYFSNELQAITAAVVLWSVVGMMFSTSSLIFEKIDWSILKQTVLHFISTYVGLLTLNVFLNWFDYTLGDMFQFTLTFIIIYLIIWSLSMVRVKRNVNKINQQLNKKG